MEKNGGKCIILIPALFDGNLSSVCSSLCSPDHREYYLITKGKTWSKAQSHCRADFTDLATIDGPDTMQRLTDITAASGKGRSIWIGLNKAGESVWMWSSGEILGEFSNWIRPLSNAHPCGSMGVDGKWLSESCVTKRPFVCQAGKFW